MTSSPSHSLRITSPDVSPDSASEQPTESVAVAPVFREFVASDGYRIRYRHWPSKQRRGIVLGIHGIQSHSGWYKYSSRRMAEAGFDVYFADRRGSGLNGRQRGHASHGMRLVNDVRELRQIAIAESQTADAGETPQVCVMGISWGGKIAAASATLFPTEFQSLALLYPGLFPRIGPTWSQQLRLTLARRLEVTKEHIPIPLSNPALFTQVEEWQRFIVEDPLALHTVTSSFLNAGRDLDDIVQTRVSQLQQPALLMLAENDDIIDNKKTRAFFQSLPTRSLTLRTWEGARHTLEFEPDRVRIFDELLNWLNSVHVQPS
ncbi:MAG: alpha/beta fold hydrolase [Planctomycetaceae bacterium]|nr:alpha/beta fold hydrolase [Planctomycetaceae bacterium]